MNQNIKSRISSILSDNNHFLENYIKEKLPRSYYKREMKNNLKNDMDITNYKLKEKTIKDIHSFWNDRLGISVSLDWYKVYSAISGIEDYRFVPDDIFFKKIEPKLNRHDLAYAYEDKNNYNKLFPRAAIPQTLLRNINGNYYDEDYNLLDFNDAVDKFQQIKDYKLIIKPSIISGGGRNVKLITNDDFKTISSEDYFNNLVKDYKKDFIIQFYLNQHQQINKIYSNTLNVLRIFSLRYKGNIHILSGLLRMGNSGKKPDNSTLGELSCGLTSEGKLNDFATEDFSYQKFYKHPDTKVLFKGAYIPGYGKVKCFVKELHKALLYFDTASWDIAVNENSEPVLIEVNLEHQGVDFLQRNNGPIFGDLTDEVLNNMFKEKV